MDRVRLHAHLAQAERHIAEGQGVIARQRATIAHLKSSGCDTQVANELLEQFEATQSLYLADRDRLLKTLGIRSLTSQ